MSYRDFVPWTPTRAAIALVLAFWMLATGAHWDQSRGETGAAHGPHALDSGWVAEFGVVADHQHPVVEHPHVQDASKHAVPDSYATTMLRRATTALVALGLFLVALTLTPLWRQFLQVAARGPPRDVALILTGRGMLTRLCIARR